MGRRLTVDDVRRAVLLPYDANSWSENFTVGQGYVTFSTVNNLMSCTTCWKRECRHTRVLWEFIRSGGRDRI